MLPLLFNFLCQRKRLFRNMLFQIRFLNKLCELLKHEINRAVERKWRMTVRELNQHSILPVSNIMCGQAKTFCGVCFGEETLSKYLRTSICMQHTNVL